MSERDIIEFDVLVVGAGPAGLACGIRLKQLKPDLNVCVIEKGSQVGAHILSGAVIEPEPLDELLPGWREAPPPICVPAKRDEFSLLTKTGRYRLPTPPQQHNRGNFIVSLGATCAWLAQHAETAGVEIYPGFAAQEALFDAAGERVIGVRIGDMGVDREGQPKDTYTQGIDIHAAVTVLAEGCRGSISKQLIQRFGLDENAQPQTYGIGMKELWQLPQGRVEPGLIQHTIGWPLDSKTYGGSFLYHLDDNRVAVGFVAGLDYTNPRFEPFEAFQQFKHHPAVKPLLEGGEIIASGARAIVEGGIQSLPRLEMPGALLIGDAAGTLNVPKIKGTHMALRSGMLAAEHLEGQLDAQGFDQRWRASASARELHRVRNIRPGFQRGLWLGLANAALETVVAGRTPWTLANHADYAALQRRSEAPPSGADFVERELPPRDRLASVYFAATEHDEDQPVHLRVADTELCVTRCTEEYGNPCTRFCPAGVYEIVREDGRDRLQINAANCVHCKTCDIKDPYEVITWTVPEGGSGPNYENL
ncbi:MAG: electron transfer flavoprotein-ubiquinone oxidoreductase [Pseudomonadota bacterium]|nr:electron transfer flavoprotein-ubiquinone oxidoreductase [Pseudomonadota bacterium]